MHLEDYLAHNPKKHLIFDLDETLARLEIDWTHCFEYLYEAVNTIDPLLSPFPTKNAREFYSLINTVGQKYGARIRQDLVHHIGEFEQKTYSGYTPNPELLTFVKSNTYTYSFSLWTSNTSSTIQEFLEKEDLIEVFKTVATLDTVRYAKPDPDGFYMIYDSAQDKKKYLMIGDSANDEEAAKNAGIDFFRIDYFTR